MVQGIEGGGQVVGVVTISDFYMEHFLGRVKQIDISFFLYWAFCFTWARLIHHTYLFPLILFGHPYTYLSIIYINIFGHPYFFIYIYIHIYII